MINQIGPPRVFITLSAADLHWPELHDLLLPLNYPANLNADDRYNFRRNNLNNSPALASWLLQERVTKFFDMAPNAPNADVHPCQPRVGQLRDDEDYGNLQNMVLRHTRCTPGYCLLKDKRTQQQYCRFHFPKELAENASLVKDERDKWQLITARNDRLLNNHNDGLNLYEDNNLRRLQHVEADQDEENATSTDVMVNYMRRQGDIEEYSLRMTATQCVWSRINQEWTMLEPKKWKILSVFPKIAEDVASEQYCRQRIYLDVKFRLSTATQEIHVDVDNDEEDYEVVPADGAAGTEDPPWMALARMGPNADANLLQGIEAGQLGRRALDVGHDWEAYGLTLSADQVITGYVSCLEQREFSQRVQHNFTNPDLLNSDQRKVFELVLRQFERSRHNLPVEQILLIVQGSAGTGKSFLTKALRCELNRADNVEYSPTCILLAPTGVAACDIGGRTVHIDDLYQLPPVLDKSLYSRANATPDVADVQTAFLLYRKFSKAVVLSIPQRQVGETPQAVAFRALLWRLWEGASTLEDWRLLSTRFLTALPPAERNRFNASIHLYKTNAPADAQNVQVIADMGVAVARILAVHNNAEAAKASYDQAGGLDPVIYLATGCRVMLNLNL
ncbi:hypothetical protein RvY_13309 [Ramazzottius varieornatus]|uniref:ATP-dependent DNA helicase n=1 Tax=Ramazzottius varieornatus TaxID=947166 RepID=A0A1D1VMG5_RAMVA|nr:hypothetical protein RvY_13309 [Ramazzottius varieornatus]